MGGWTKIVQGDPHKCLLPKAAEISFRNAKAGSQWKCGCGKLWQLSWEKGSLTWWSAGRIEN